MVYWQQSVTKQCFTDCSALQSSVLLTAGRYKAMVYWQQNVTEQCFTDCSTLQSNGLLAAERYKAVSYCLQDCLREIDQDRLAGLSRSCEFDMCHVKNDITDIMCTHAQAVVEECQITTGVTVTEWRTPDFCGKRFCSVWSSFRTGKCMRG